MIKAIIAGLLICLSLSSCYVYRAYRGRNFNLKDLPKLPAQTVHKSSTPFYFQTDTTTERYHRLHHFLDSVLENSQTYSFLVVRNDTIIYDRYLDGLTADHIFPSFSVAKSFVATLAEIAREEGAIKGFDEPITHYLPYLLKNDPRFEKITIQHLLDMRSGIKSNENYGSPFSDVIKLGFRSNIQHQLKKLKIASPPGKQEYVSVNSQLLGMVVQAATGKKLYTYLQEKLWQPLGMEADATWNIDSRKHNTAKAFCCLNAVTHDFAKLGRLYLQKGAWQGKQIIDSNWVKGTIDPDTFYKYEGYKNQWWGTNTYPIYDDSLKAVEFAGKHLQPIPVKGFIRQETGQKAYYFSFPGRDFQAEGILGQYIYVNPATHVIIVRTGHYWNEKKISEDRLLQAVGRGFSNN